MKLVTGPHEVLVRYGRDRKLQGFHVVLVTQACNDDGTPILNPDGSVSMEQFSDAMPMNKAVAAGLDPADLAGLMNLAQAQSLANWGEERDRADALAVRVEALEQEISNLCADLSRLTDPAQG